MLCDRRSAQHSLLAPFCRSQQAHLVTMPSCKSFTFSSLRELHARGTYSMPFQPVQASSRLACKTARFSIRRLSGSSCFLLSTLRAAADSSLDLQWTWCMSGERELEATASWSRVHSGWCWLLSCLSDQALSLATRDKYMCVLIKHFWEGHLACQSNSLPIHLLDCAQIAELEHFMQACSHAAAFEQLPLT